MLDFHNVYQFHHCLPAIEHGPYAPDGNACGDVSDRSFIYPPLMYWTFAWTRFTQSYELAAGIWRLVLIGAMLVVGGLWILWCTRGRDRHVRRRVLLGLAWVLILTQFPFVFSLERGNNDVLVVVAWAGVVAAILSRRYLLAGVAAGVAFALKLYPAVAIMILLVGLLGVNLRRTARFGAGLGIGILVPSLLLLRDTVLFVDKVLPATFRESGSGLHLFAHSLYSLPIPGLLVAVLGLAMVLPWIAAAYRRFTDAPLLVLSGGLAISTYFGELSYDYNLVTVLPLILLVVAMGIEETGFGLWKALSLIVSLVVLAGRDLLTPIGLVVGQALTLGSIGLALATRPQTGSEDEKGSGLNAGWSYSPRHSR
jgi:hypothetical protein